jgi:hypothetical protein
MILVMRGSRGRPRTGRVRDRNWAKLPSSGRSSKFFMPFGGKEDAFWEHARTWPGDIQNRAGAALDYLRPKESARLSAEARRRDGNKDSTSGRPQPLGTARRTQVRSAARFRFNQSGK